MDARPNAQTITRQGDVGGVGGYVTFVDPIPTNGVYVFARIADELGRLRPDIPLLVVEGAGSEIDLAACGLDLRAHGNVNLMPHPSDPRLYWSVTRICVVPATGTEPQNSTVVGALVNGIPVVCSDRGGLPRALGSAAIVLPLPDQITSKAYLLPAPEDVAPWIQAIVRLWDDLAWYEEHHQRALTEGQRHALAVVQAQTSPLAAEGLAGRRPEPVREPGEPRRRLGRPVKPSLEAGLAIIKQRWPNLHNDNNEEPIFLLAAGWRSGSTLLQRLVFHRCFLWGEPFGHAGLIDSMADHLRCFTDAWPQPHHFYQGDDAEALGQAFIANLYPSVQDLLRAHQEFVERLFAEPARRAGAERWGFKEVRLRVDHALYLKWLFPRAKFLFLIRNPYDAWRSYAARAEVGWQWFNRWPDEPVTVRSFAAHWSRLVTSFLNDHPKVDGLVVRYEDLERGEYAAIEDYLGFPLSQEAGQANPSDGGPPPLKDLPESDRIALDEGLGTLAASLGYAYPMSPRETPRIAPNRQPRPGQVEMVHQKPPQETTAKGSPRVTSSDPARCVILVPVGHHIEPACDDALRALEQRGYPVWRVRGYSAIDQGRNQIATDALRQGFEELMWVDSDVAFEPGAVEHLRSHGLPISCGVYPKKGRRAFACNFTAETKQVLFGQIGGLVEIPYAGAGFLHTRREVYQAVQDHFQLPSCNERFGPSMTPFFHPLVIPDGAGHWYLAEDFSFCYRARECGYRIMADTTIRLMHIGSYNYSWEDAGGERPRYGNYTFHITD